MNNGSKTKTGPHQNVQFPRSYGICGVRLDKETTLDWDLTVRIICSFLY
jgi:hypothetical protein